MAILLATALSIFIGLLPISYMHWRDRVRERFDRKAKSMIGVGSEMEKYGVKMIHFSGCFRFMNTKLNIDIHDDSRFKQRMEDYFREHGGRFVELTPKDSNETVLHGLMELAGLTFRRGYRVFMLMLSLLSTILVFTMVLLIVEIPQEMYPEWILAILLIASVLAFLVFSFSVFADKDSSWYFTWSTKDGIRMMNSVMWERQI